MKGRNWYHLKCVPAPGTLHYAEHLPYLLMIDNYDSDVVAVIELGAKL